MNRIKRIFGRAILGAALLGASAAAWAIPVNFNISGRLEDASGNPLIYNIQHGPSEVERDVQVSLQARVTFYNSSSSATVLDDMQVTATAKSGYFNIPVVMKDNLLAQDSLWYALAIDTNQNGLDGNDNFAGRFQINAVPFALSAKPVKYFSTHGGSVSTGSGMRWGYTSIAKASAVAPFVTPPGGVRFNRMNIFVGIAVANTNFSFGLYDQTGKQVVSSGKIAVGAAGFEDAYLEVKTAEFNLAPSQMYFTAILADPPSNISLRNIIVPGIPLVGLIRNMPAGGVLPATLDLKAIQVPTDTAEAIPLSIELSYDEAASAPSAQRAGVSEGANPNVRWIPTSTSKK